jgi:hypothetical protein
LRTYQPRVESVLVESGSGWVPWVFVESVSGLVVAGEGVSQAINPSEATMARKNKFFIPDVLVF